MLSWLKKVGIVAAKGAAVISGVDKVLPIIQAIAPKGAQDELQAVQDTLPKLASVIEQVEMAGAALSLPGPQKLTAATPLIAQALLKSPLLNGKKPQDEALFQKACSEYAQATVDLLNSFGAEHVSEG